MHTKQFMNNTKKMTSKILFYGAFTKENVVCRYNSDSQRKVDPAIEKKAKNIWKDKVKEAKEKGSLIWDQDVYRLEGFQLKKDKCILNFSTIPFSLRSTLKDFSQQLYLKGEDYLPMATYSSIFLETSDSFFVFGEKSDKYVANRKYTYIGGVFNRSEAGTMPDIFNEAQREVKEEIGLTDKNIKEIKLLGAFRSNSFNVGFIFHCELNLTRAEVKKKFSENNDVELKNLFFSKKDKARDVGTNKIGKESEIVDIFEKYSNA